MEQRVRLIPVVEFVPSDYANREAPSGPEPVEAWIRYWHDCLAGAGITGLRQIKPGHWCVSTDQLTDAHTLECMVRVQHTDTDDEDVEVVRIDPDDIIGLCGGYALELDGEVRITPRCCGDLDDLREWQEAAEYRDSKRRDLWIGHPEIFVRFEGSHLLFSESQKRGDRGEWAGEIAISPEDLQESIEQAKRELQTFYDHLLPVIEKMVAPEHAPQVTQILTACPQFSNAG